MNLCGRDVAIQGGLIRIASLDGDKYRFLDDPERMIEALRRSGKRVDIFTFLQRLPETSPKYSYPMEWDNFATIRIKSFEDWWENQLGFKARNKAKQAVKRGVELREMPLDDTLVRGIWEIYNESPMRQGKPFRHYGKDLATVRREAATFLESSIWIGAVYCQKLIGFIKLTMDETCTQAGLMNIVSMISHRDKAPTNALVAQAVRSCAERGVSYMVYSNFSYGNKLRDSLSDFKERNGFQKIDVPRYYVPLTHLGRLAVRYRLYRKLSERVPEPIAMRLREWRRAWYEKRFKSVSEAY